MRALSERLHGAKTHAKTRAKTHANTHANIFFASNCDKPLITVYYFLSLLFIITKFVRRTILHDRTPERRSWLLSQFHAKFYVAQIL